MRVNVTVCQDIMLAKKEKKNTNEDKSVAYATKYEKII